MRLRLPDSVTILSCAGAGGCIAPEKWPVGTYRGWSVNRVPVPTGPIPQYATESDHGFPWLAERGEQWVCADSYDWLLKAIDDEMAAGAA